jgi:hypothetical protein
MRAAREAFSLYRLAKYRWLDALPVASADERIAYQELEA